MVADRSNDVFAVGEFGHPALSLSVIRRRSWDNSKKQTVLSSVVVLLLAES